MLIASVFVVVSAQPQLKKPIQEGERQKREELRKKIKETLDSANSEVFAVKSPETRAFLQVRIACLLWSYDEKGARSLLDDAQGLTASMINDPKIKSPTWADRMGLRGEFVSMIAERDPATNSKRQMSKPKRYWHRR